MLLDHLPALLPVVPLSVALALPVAGLVRRGVVYPTAVATGVATTLLALLALQRVLAEGELRYAVGGWPAPWGIELVVDHLSAFVAVAVSGMVALAIVYAAPPRRAPESAGAFYGLVLLFLASLMGIVVTGDLFNLFVFLEVASLSSYALVASGGGRALLAAFRYLLLGTVGASFYLLGVGHLYVLTGTLNMADLAARLPELAGSRVFAVAVGFLVIGLGIKMALFPLHGWLPDAYTYAPPAVTALLAPVTTKVAAYALARVLFSVLGGPETLGRIPLGVLAWAGAVAVVAGGVLALRQSDLRRLLAYSSVSQVGFIALGLGLANQPGLAGAYLHILSHALMKGCLFFVAGAVVVRLGGPALADLRLMRERMPWTTVCLVVAALSMIGIPPTAGFFSKWYLLVGAIEAGQPLLAAVIAGGGLLTAVYMWRVVEHACLARHGDSRSHAGPRAEAPPAMLVALLAAVAGILAVGIWSAPLVARVLLPAASSVG
ncbi:MAG: monovalent cation/H+ antiporter subunit D family protein [Candidatus Rokubacteria bacterium]|nr:monovalent cation/H+ antiporter subunit D family protein [Candidatus Rokubacteria bacterium]